MKQPPVIKEQATCMHLKCVSTCVCVCVCVCVFVCKRKLETEGKPQTSRPQHSELAKVTDSLGQTAEAISNSSKTELIKQRQRAHLSK
jgi:hypothetical protein